MKRDVGGGCGGEEGQIDESLIPNRCLVQGTKLEQLPLPHLGATAPRLEL